GEARLAEQAGRLEELRKQIRDCWPPKQPSQEVKERLAIAVTSIVGYNSPLNLRMFDPTGRKFCQRLTEDAASLGLKKLTSRHLLYTILDNESGLVATALSVRGIDVKKDLHAVLTRELARPGKKRNDSFALTRETLFEAVIQVPRHSLSRARERGAT